MIVHQPDSVAVEIPTWNRVRRALQSCGAVDRMAVAGALALVGVVALTATEPVIHGVFLAVSGGLLVGAALVDLHEFRLPNRLLALAAGAALLGSLAASEWSHVLGCALGGFVCGGAMLAVHVGRGVGMGDVKAAAVVGMCCGSVALILAPVALAIGTVTAAAAGWVLHRQRLALGPSLVVGWAAALGLSGWWL